MLLWQRFSCLQYGLAFRNSSSIQSQVPHFVNKFSPQRFIISKPSIIKPTLASFIPYHFSTIKKTTKNPQKKIFKLKKTQLVPGQNIFLLYNGEKQQKSFQIISGLFILLFGLSLVKLYYTESQERRDDYIVLFIVVGSFIIYQRRIVKTLKRVTLNPSGDKLKISTFNILGMGEKTMEAPVEIMNGIYRATRLGGYMLKGGGKSSMYKQMKFWFTKQYITDQQTFEYVMQGRIPKVVDQYQSL